MSKRGARLRMHNEQKRKAGVQPRRKPRRVVLGTGKLQWDYRRDKSGYRIGQRNIQHALFDLFGSDGELEPEGTLVWEPDPPKAKRRA